MSNQLSHRTREQEPPSRALERPGSRLLRSAREALNTRSSDGSIGQTLAHGLGWFSIGLGLAEVSAPSSVAKLIGVRDDADNQALLRVCGLREISSGLGILSSSQPASLLWGRVGGDLMDLFLLGTAAASPDTQKGRLAGGALAVVGVTALDVLGAALQDGSAHEAWRSRKLSAGAYFDGRRPPTRGQELPAGAFQVKKSITVRRTPDQVYRFWRDFSNLPKFMHHLESVQVLDGKVSHWRVRAPAGMSVEWDAEIAEERPNEMIAWRSLQGADVCNAGLVRFKSAPGGRGTEVTVELYYQPPAGKIGRLVAKLFGEEPAQQVKHDLFMFKQVMETGEVVHSDASIHRGPHPARPAHQPMLREGGLS
jgi:uncharacterized membrane protein